MKKYIALLLAFLCIISLAACGAKESDGPPYYFIGEVTEIYDSENTFLLKVTDYCNYKFNSKNHSVSVCQADKTTKSVAYHLK